MFTVRTCLVYYFQVILKVPSGGRQAPPCVSPPNICATTTLEFELPVEADTPMDLVLPYWGYFFGTLSFDFSLAIPRPKAVYLTHVSFDRHLQSPRSDPRMKMYAQVHPQRRPADVEQRRGGLRRGRQTTTHTFDDAFKLLQCIDGHASPPSRQRRFVVVSDETHLLAI